MSAIVFGPDSKLPRTLDEWKAPKGEETWHAEAALWEAVRPVFQQADIDLWKSTGYHFQRARPSETLCSSGFAYLTPHRHIVWADRLTRMAHWNGATRGATTGEGHKVVVRIVAIGQEGKTHLDILRIIGRGVANTRTDNHAIPLWREVHIGDMVFAVFPFVGACLDECASPESKNSVGDILDMILQCLEALAYIHSIGIAHRDAYRSNFLLQWQPESLAAMQVPVTRPRVYLIDFEHAYKHAPGTTSTLLKPVTPYFPEIAPEVHSGRRYDPFKPDVWQLANGFSYVRTTIIAFDKILDAMAEPRAMRRPSASQARDQLARALSTVAPASLLIPLELNW